jgi:hypothetical protein
MYFCMTMLPFSSFFPSLPQLPMDPTCMVLVLHLMIFIDFSTNFFFHCNGDFWSSFYTCTWLLKTQFVHIFHLLQDTPKPSRFIFSRKSASSSILKYKWKRMMSFSVLLWQGYKSWMELYYGEGFARRTMLLAKPQ